MASTGKLKNFLSFVLRIVLSGALLFWLFRKIDINKTAEVIKSADLNYILLAGLIFFLINFVLLTRWLIFIRALDLSVSIISVVRYYLIGLFGNLFLPSAIGGDVIKILGLCRDSSQKPRVVASVLLDRLSGFAGIVCVAVGAFIVGHHLMGNMLIVPIIVMAGVSLMFALVLFNAKVYSLVCAIFNGLPKFKESLMKMHYDIQLLKNKKAEGFKGIGLSALAQMIFAFCFFLLAKALHQDVSIIYFLIFVPIICVAASLPSIGGLGVREASAAYLFTKVGMEPGIAVSISLINFLFMVLVGLLGGAIYVATVSFGRVQHSSPTAHIRSSEI